MPLLVRAWGSAEGEATGVAKRRAVHRRQQLWGWQQRGARLTLGVPRCPWEAMVRWLGVRLAWWPHGIPTGRRVGLASSRLGHAVDTQRAWFLALRAVCGQADAERDVLLAATGTAAARYVERGAALFGLRTLRLEAAEGDVGNWFSRVLKSEPHAPEAGVRPLVLSPPLTAEARELTDVPVRDRALVALSERLMVFRIRPSGHVHRLLQARLTNPAWPVASVYVALGAQLVRTEMAAELMGLGAVGWVVLEPPPGVAQPAEAALGAAGPPQGGQPAPIVPLPPADGWPFLAHSTRRCEGPWPDQDETEYLDDLILARPEADHSPLAALRRIVRSGRLIASGRTIRGGTPVVSFTAVPLAELSRLRVFRPHRGRWDFEPYGICIRRDWLQGLGARPVLYGDDLLWEQLGPEERPFFQLRRTRRAPGRAVDWAVEDEWRVVGDLSLERLPREGGLLFVPTLEEAKQMAAISRWPVTVVRV
ncbi:MAG TPA: hypothetical protein EYP56_05205 [Planctomycetaceae bacterium]|nr:hypothetical protein [Planctomycetaceae bacterium]HIQ22972.1 hypothetical protein [Planctomycetota bacterium]